MNNNNFIPAFISCVGFIDNIYIYIYIYIERERERERERELHNVRSAKVFLAELYNLFVQTDRRVRLVYLHPCFACMWMNVMQKSNKVILIRPLDINKKVKQHTILTLVHNPWCDRATATATATDGPSLAKGYDPIYPSPQFTQPLFRPFISSASPIDDRGLSIHRERFNSLTDGIISFQPLPQYKNSEWTGPSLIRLRFDWNAIASCPEEPLRWLGCTLWH